KASVTSETGSSPGSEKGSRWIDCRPYCPCLTVGTNLGFRTADRQSVEADQERRTQLVWEIERKLAEDGARPIFFYDRRATCWQPRVKGLTIMVNSISNSARMEDVWLDK